MEIAIDKVLIIFSPIDCPGCGVLFGGGQCTINDLIYQGAYICHECGHEFEPSNQVEVK